MKWGKLSSRFTGSKVLNRHDNSPLPIAVTTIRGAQSNGMLCSPGELGIVTEDVNGILILDKAANLKLGADIKEILSLSCDHILHVAPRSNRGDALSVRGLAREVAALTKRPLKQPSWSSPNHVNEKLEKFKVKIEDTEDCDYFTIRSLANIQVGPSPAFIKKRLESVGLRSINNIVDITNYVMHEFGQPLHAYDSNKIAGASFIVRRAKPNEKVKTLDGKERNLSEEILVIADEKNIVRYCWNHGWIR